MVQGFARVLRIAATYVGSLFDHAMMSYMQNKRAYTCIFSRYSYLHLKHNMGLGLPGQKISLLGV